MVRRGCCQLPPWPEGHRVAFDGHLRVKRGGGAVCTEMFSQNVEEPSEDWWKLHSSTPSDGSNKEEWANLEHRPLYILKLLSLLCCPQVSGGGYDPRDPVKGTAEAVWDQVNRPLSVIRITWAMLPSSGRRGYYVCLRLDD